MKKKKSKHCQFSMCGRKVESIKELTPIKYCWNGEWHFVKVCPNCLNWLKCNIIIETNKEKKI